MPKLPDAQDSEGVVAGNGGRPLKLLVIGESTMSGVGVATHEAGFAGALARTLAAGWGTEVQWKVYARSGYTLKRLRHELLPVITEDQADLIVAGMGGNEAFKLNTPAGFRRDMQAVIDFLRERFGPDVPIAFPKMPPIKEFPASTQTRIIAILPFPCILRPRPKNIAHENCQSRSPLAFLSHPAS